MASFSKVCYWWHGCASQPDFGVQAMAVLRVLYSFGLHGTSDRMKFVTVMTRPDLHEHYCPAMPYGCT